MKKGSEESKPCFRNFVWGLDADAVFHIIAAVVTGVGIEIVRCAMIQKVAGTKVASNVDANGHGTSRH